MSTAAPALVTNPIPNPTPNPKPNPTPTPNPIPNPNPISNPNPNPNPNPDQAGASSLTSLTFPGATANELEEAKGRLRAAFDKFDTNQSGKLDHKELRSALKEAGLEMDSGKAQELLEKYDKDQSGLMEFDEFVDLSVALNRVALNVAGTLKPVETTAPLGSGSAPRPLLPQPRPRAAHLLLGSGPSRFEATSQPSVALPRLRTCAQP
jgi:hypothetical protein